MSAIHGRAPLVPVGLGGPVVLGVSAFLLIGMRQSLTVPLSFGLSVGQLIPVVCGVLWVLTRLRGQPSPLRNRFLIVAILLYLVGCLLSYASAMGLGIPQNALDLASQYMFITSGMVAAAFAIMAMVTTTDGILIVLKGLLIGGWLSATFAIIQFATGKDLASQFRLPGLRATNFLLVKDLMREGIVRPQGSASHPLELATVLTTLIPIGIGVLGCARAKGERVWPWALCTVTLTAGALVTVSRSFFLGLAAAVAVMCWRWSIQRTAATLASLTAVAGLGWMLQLKIVTAFASSFASSSHDSSIASRTNGLDYTLQHYRDHFWFGQGVGTYPAYSAQPVLDNEYLSRLAESGVVGIATYVGLLGIALMLAIRSSASASTINAEIGSGLSGGLAVLMAAGTIIDLSGFTQCSLLSWYIIALIPVALHVSAQRDAMPEHPSKEDLCVLSPRPAR